MPQVTIPSKLDSRTGRLVSRFENEDSTGKYTAARFVAQCVLSAGLQPSYAFPTAPMAQFGAGAFDQRGMQVAMKKSGPAGKLKLLTRAEIYYEAAANAEPARLMTGWLVSISHQIGMNEDSAVMQVYDDKIILDKFTVSGRLCWNPTIGPTGKFYWDPDAPCIFNPMGYPICVDSPLGPVFAPCHRFGYKDSFKQSAISDDPALDTTQPAKGAARTQARDFDCDDAIKYLRLVHFLATRSKLPPARVDLGLTQIPHYIDWPENLGNLSGFTERKLKHENMQGADGKGQGLGTCLQQIARKAGSYDLYMKATGEFKSEISFVNLNPGQNTTVRLLLPDYDPGIRNAVGALVIKEGHITFNATDYFHETCMEGDAPSVELGMWCKGFGTGGYDQAFGAYGDADGLENGLEPAWSNVDDFLARAYVSANMGGGPDYPDFDEALQQAFELYPWWLCAYRVKRDFNPWTGTKWDKMKNGGRMRFKPFLNTGYQMDSSSPQNWQPRRIVFEKYVDNSVENIDERDESPDVSAFWIRMNAGTADGLTLSADSTVFIINGARQGLDTWVKKIHLDGDGNPVGTPVDRLGARPIRATAIAVQGDWPITGRKGKEDPNNTRDLVNQSFKYCWRVKSPPGDYQELLRRGDAFPVGKAGFPGTITTAFPPHVARGDELYTDRVDENTGILPDHSTARLRDVKRVSIYAKVRIPQLCPQLRPGTVVEIEGDQTIPCQTVIKSVVFSMVGTTRDKREVPAVPDTWIETGPPDFAVLMAGNSAGMAITSGGDSGYQGGGGHEDPYKKYEYDIPGKPVTTADEPKRPMDEYEKADAKERGVQAPQQPAAQVGGAASASRKSTRTENIKKAIEDRSSDALDKGRDKDVARMNSDLRKEEKKQENRQNFKRDKAEQLRNKGGMNGKDVNLGDWLGKPNHGSMTDTRGKTHNSIMGNGTPGFGVASQGSMSGAMTGNVKAGELGKGAFDTTRSDQYDRDHYRSVASQHTTNTFTPKTDGVEAFMRHHMEMKAPAGASGQPGQRGMAHPKPPPAPRRPQAPAKDAGADNE